MHSHKLLILQYLHFLFFSFFVRKRCIGSCQNNICCLFVCLYLFAQPIRKYSESSQFSDQIIFYRIGSTCSKIINITNIEGKMRALEKIYK